MTFQKQVRQNLGPNLGEGGGQTPTPKSPHRFRLEVQGIAEGPLGAGRVLK